VAEGEFTVDEGMRLCESWKERTKFSTSVRDNRINIQKIRKQYEQVFIAANQSEPKGIFSILKSRLTRRKTVIDIRISVS